MDLDVRKHITEWVKTIVMALVLSLFIRTYVAEARWIPSESMVPTLKIQDHLLIDKVSYKIQDIQRGDIVVFKAPEALHTKDDLIKRVVGLPGETISAKDGVIYIDDRPLEEPYLTEKTYPDFEAVTIPNKHIFVMGDNRDNSYDSRYWGPLAEDQIIGKALVRYYPLNQINLLD